MVGWAGEKRQLALEAQLFEMTQAQGSAQARELQQQEVVQDLEDRLQQVCTLDADCMQHTERLTRTAAVGARRAGNGRESSKRALWTTSPATAVANRLVQDSEWY